MLVELFKHKERIAASTGLDEDSLLALLHSLLERIRFFDEDAISIGGWTEAWRLCRDVDENDVAYVALTLEVDGDLWTSDRRVGGWFAQEGFYALFQPGVKAQADAGAAGRTRRPEPAHRAEM